MKKTNSNYVEVYFFIQILGLHKVLVRSSHDQGLVWLGNCKVRVRY